MPGEGLGVLALLAFIAVIFLIAFGFGCLAEIAARHLTMLWKRILSHTRKSFIAYKGLDDNLRGWGKFQYAIGKTYVHPNHPYVCDRGFHFYRKLKDVLSEYPPSEGYRICEVKVMGEVDQDFCTDKCCTDVIQIVRELKPVDFQAILWRQKGPSKRKKKKPKKHH